MNRRATLLAFVALTAAPLVAKPQQARNLPVMGFLHPGFPGLANPTIEGLREGGYVDGETIKIEARYGLGKPGSLIEGDERLLFATLASFAGLAVLGIVISRSRSGLKPATSRPILRAHTKVPHG